MNRPSSQPDELEDQSGARRVNLIVTCMGLLFYFLLEVLSWFTERGGVFSALSGLVAVHRNSSVIDIDQNALRFPIFIILCLFIMGLSRLVGFQIDLRKRRQVWMPILFVIGGGFILDEVFGEALVTHYMVSNGYRRCAPGDWAQGNGKSRVWFADYVFRGVERRDRKQTIPERTLFR